MFTLCLPETLDHRELAEQQVELAEDLPDAEEHQPLLRKPLAKAAAATRDLAPFAGQRVLLVDDELRNLLALTPRLEAWGFQVVAAGDAQEAIDTLHEDQAFSLVLMDLLMPGRDGYDTIREIREKMQLTALVIIALGAGPSVEDRERCLQAGADDCLTGPLDFDALRAVITRQLSEA